MSTELMAVLSIVLMGGSLFLAMEIKHKLARLFWCVITAGWLWVMIMSLIKVSQELAA